MDGTVNNKEKIVFVTVGTTAFDQLIQEVTKNELTQIFNKKGFNKVIMQVGAGTVNDVCNEQNGVHFDSFRYKDTIQDYIASAALVISHAGSGSIFETLSYNKPLIVVINEDLMDNHQIELAERMGKEGFLHHCTCRTLAQTLLDFDITRMKPYKSGRTYLFGEYLDKLFCWDT